MLFTLRRWFLFLIVAVIGFAYWSGRVPEKRTRIVLPANFTPGYEMLTKCIGSSQDAKLVNCCVRNFTRLRSESFQMFHSTQPDLNVHFLPFASSNKNEILDSNVKVQCLQLTLGTNYIQFQKEFSLEFPDCKIFGIEDEHGSHSDFWNYGSVIHFGALSKYKVIHFLSIQSPTLRLPNLNATFCQADIFVPKTEQWTLSELDWLPIHASQSEAGARFTLIDPLNVECEEMFEFSKYFQI